jgi:hypothetical protein
MKQPHKSKVPVPKTEVLGQPQIYDLYSNNIGISMVCKGFFG